MNDRATPLAPCPEQNKCADDRHDESGRMKRRSGRGPREEPRNQTSDDGPANAEKRGHDESEMLHTRHDGASDPSDNETDNDRPNDV